MKEVLINSINQLWSNFVLSVAPNVDIDFLSVEWFARRDQMLKDASVRLENRPGDGPLTDNYLIFTDEDAYTAFLLKYG